MNDTQEIEVKRHSFELAKNRLKEFSEKPEAELRINKVKEGSWFFNLGDHFVKGDELNNRLGTIQEHFISVNTTNNTIIKEFRAIYDVLDILDKDYIASIVENVKAIEKTGEDIKIQQKTLKQHNRQLNLQQNKLNVHQTEIEKQVTNIFKIVTVVRDFKEKLESYSHLTDIDEIWDSCKTVQKELRTSTDNFAEFSSKTTADITEINNKNKDLSEQVNGELAELRSESESLKEILCKLSKKLEDTAISLESRIPLIEETTAFAEHLKNIAHIDDIDLVWDNTNKTMQRLAGVEDRLKNIESDILKMQKHSEKIDFFVTAINSYVHLRDIDKMWDGLELCKRNIEKTNSMNSTQQSELNKISVEVRKNCKEANDKFAEMSQNAATVVAYLTKKVKYAYWIAGGAAGLAIVELMLLLIKVI